MQRKLLFIVFLLLLTSCQTSWARLPIRTADDRCFIASGNGGAISCGHPLAAQTALEVLRAGGNAIDAAVCAGFMLGVVDFSNSGIGGDGYALIHTADGKVLAFDASVKRPLFTRNRQPTNHIGLPTAVDLLLRLRRHYGSFPLDELMQPAIKTAKEGFKLSAYLEKIIERSLLKMSDPAARLFLAPQGYPLRAGQTLKQPLLAKTLNSIACDDGRSFYRGNIAASLVADLQAHGSDYRLPDLALFQTRLVKPVRRDWQDYSLYGTPPPSSSLASIKLAEDLLNSRFNLHQQQPADIIACAQTGRRVLQAKYDTMARCLAEPYRFIDFTDSVVVNKSGEPVENGNTTHLCVVDHQGTMISLTLTLGSHFGTGQFSPGGFFYNNGLRNFTDVVSGYPTDYPNDAGPISAKSPVIVSKNGQAVLAIGGAGSDRIVFNTGLALARYLQQPHHIDNLVSRPRYFLDYRNHLHLEWQPDSELLAEVQLYKPASEIRPGCDDYFGLLAAIAVENGEFKALADPRRDGSCAAFSLISP